MLQNRSIVTAIILSIVTCGIYGWVWYYKMTDEINNASGDNSMSAGICLLLAIVTCGLFNIYWGYKMGQKIVTIQNARGINDGSDNSILYAVLCGLGLSIVTYALIQNEENKLA